jgi:glycosyltransferase involved in cell wall biosynthesis
MVVLEALALGVPVIATKVEGTPEIVRDGMEGLLAEPGCAPSISDEDRTNGSKSKRVDANEYPCSRATPRKILRRANGETNC